MNTQNKRRSDKRQKDCGVLLPIFSLPSRYGIGDLGREAYAFVDFLHSAGQTYWQILPVGPTSYGDSPYQSPSSFAANPYFIDLEDLYRQGLLTAQECKDAERTAGPVDYGDLFATRLPLLRKAYERAVAALPDDFAVFCRENAYWLDSYALFTALKQHFALRPHWEWPRAYARPDSAQVQAFAAQYKSEIDFVRWQQFVFDVQWQKLRAYAHEKQIRMFGDTPIYAAYDSADVWENPRRFVTDAQGKPTEVAGVPPDYFSADGQLWGNPLYDWAYMQANGYDYWIDKLRRAFSLYDVLRIDHFRGFCAYYAIDAHSATAREGVWRSGPGKALFDAVESRLGRRNIVAEDLGVDAPELRALLRDCGYPGMKVVQFGFDGAAKNNAHAVCNFTENSVGYTGTHDNDTSLGWFASLSAEARKRVRSRLPRGCGDVVKAMICALFGSPVRTAVVPMQDWLRQGSEARVNIPGTREGNWRYRMQEIPDKRLQEEMRATAAAYGRENKDR